MVDENRIEGAARNMACKVQDAVGSLTGDASTQARGKMNQAAGTAQNALGSAADTADELLGSIADTAKDKPLVALLIAVLVGFVFRTLTQSRRR